MPVPVEVSPFEPIRSYDIPGVLAGQILSGEASFESIKDTFLSPNDLSMDQRQTLRQRLMDQAGLTDRLSAAVIGAATNPLVWLMFLTGPVGAKSLKSGKSLFATRPEYSRWLKDRTGFVTWSETTLEMFKGTPIPDYVMSVMDRTENLRAATRTRLAATDSALLHRLQSMNKGVKNLVVEEHRARTPEAGIVKDVNLWAAAKAARLDEDVEEVVKEGFQSYTVRTGDGRNVDIREMMGELKTDQAAVDAYAGGLERKQKQHFREHADAYREATGEKKLGKEFYESYVPLYEVKKREPELFQKTQTRKAIVSKEWMRQTEEKYGKEMLDWYEARQGVMRESIVEAIGDMDEFKKSGKFVFDDGKVKRLLYSAKAKVVNPYSENQSLEGLDLISRILDVDIVNTYGDEILSQKNGVNRLKEMLKEAIDPSGDWDRGFLPRNLVKVEPVVLGSKEVRKGQHLADVDIAPQSVLGGINRVMPRTSKDPLWSIDDFKSLAKRNALTEEGKDQFEKVRRLSRDPERKKSLVTTRLDFEQSSSKYFAEVSELTAWHTDKASPALLQSERQYIGNIPKDKRNVEKATEIPLEFKVPTVKNRGGGPVRVPLHKPIGDVTDDVSPMALMDRAAQNLPDDLQHILKTEVVPGMMHRKGPEYLAQVAAMNRAKAAMRKIAKSPLGKWMEGVHPKMKDVVDEMKRLGDPRVEFDATGGISRGLAKLLYVSHLGLNMSTATLNMSQPLLLSSLVLKPQEILPAYADAIKEMVGYAQKRAKYGARLLTYKEKDDLIKDSFEFAGRQAGEKNILQISPNTKSLVDELTFPDRGKPVDRFTEVMLKLFEKTEWLNRNVAAHMLKRAYTNAGRTVRHADGTLDEAFALDAERFVAQTQFGQTFYNTPRIFMAGGGMNPLANPLGRQFLSFPFRSATAAFKEFPVYGEQEYLKGLLNVSMRGMGLSALVYEVGKGLIGADLSRGLYASAATDIFGGERLFEEGSEWVPVPPVLDVPISLVQGVAGDDPTALSNAVARVIPGGIALNRVVGIMPQAPGTFGDLPQKLQKTYADWSNPTPDGRIPIYKWDGTLVNYEKPSELVVQAMGVDLGAFEDKGGLDGYLVKQRDKMVSVKRQYLSALAAQEYGQADRIKAQFEKKWGIPLTLTEDQIDRYLRNRVIPRTERILDRMPREVRPQFAAMAAAGNRYGNVPPDTLSQFPTARERDPYRNPRRSLTDRQEAELRRRARTGPATTTDSTGGGFPSFQSY